MAGVSAANDPGVSWNSPEVFGYCCVPESRLAAGDFGFASFKMLCHRRRLVAEEKSIVPVATAPVVAAGGANAVRCDTPAPGSLK